MHPLGPYLPQDRLRALLRGETLPDRTSGAALFADISGFTPLTEALRESLGARLGAEALTKHLAAVYTVLIAEIERYNGSVLGFAGDAITCWFDDTHGPATPRAVTCAFALQTAMRAFAAVSLPNGTTTALSLKVALATGPARRFVVGDPSLHYLDALVGATVERMARGEHLAQKNEILVDEASVAALGDALTLREWRADTESEERFAVITGLGLGSEAGSVELPPHPQHASEAVIVPFILPAVYEREASGQGSFFTEFRPCAMVFVRFIGIDYESEAAHAQLDGFIRQLQRITERYGGAVLQLTIGDKGSYAYINFGALSAHEDNARRAVKAALELLAASALTLQLGISQGTLRVGAYGGVTRQTFGALGDEVNLAARLMMAANPGEIVLSGNVHQTVGSAFTFEPRPPLSLKGKAEPLPVFAVTGARQERAVRLQEPRYALPMVGRQAELEAISAKLDLVLQRQSQIIGIVADAGMGKSRLVAEVIRLARRKGFTGYGGACQSDGVHTPYLVWKAIWSAFFGVDPELSLRKRIRSLEDEIEDRAPERFDVLPLLGPLLNLEIPDNDFTKSLEPKTRQSALRALLEDCLKAAAKDEPLLLVIEDLHWIDALSHDLLEELARATANSSIALILAYRPPQLARLIKPRLEALPHFTKIELNELRAAEGEQAIRAKLAQLYPARSGAVPAALVDKLMARTQGNPFYLEELLNYLRDRGLDPRDPADLEKIELPDSLHTLILSRLDQLSEREKTLVRVASIVGRLFRVTWLMGYYPDLGEPARVKNDLDGLAEMDLTPLDTPEPELAYLFKHIVTHEVTYESLPFATRARLHEQLAHYLEDQIAAGALHDSSLLETLTHHYGRSHNAEKQRAYLRKAGEAAQQRFANQAALDYFGRLLPLLTAASERIAIHMQRGQVLELIGAWEAAEADYRAALELAGQTQARQREAQADAQFALGKLCRKRGEYEAALAWLARVRAGRTALGDRVGQAQALTETGIVYRRKGEYAQSRASLQEGLALAREAGDQAGIALALNALGNIARAQGDYPAARALYEESLALRRELGDKGGIGTLLNNLGMIVLAQGDYPTARALSEESLALCQEMGDKGGIALSLNNLGNVAAYQGDPPTARALHEECLALRRELGDKSSMAGSLDNLGYVVLQQGDYPAARALYEPMVLV